MKVFRGREATCPACGRKSDTHTNAFGNAPPQPGMVAICFYCGTLLGFADDLSFRPLTRAEFDEAMADKRTKRMLIAHRDVLMKGKRFQ